jgi:hypothetical protein
MKKLLLSIILILIMVLTPMLALSPVSVKADSVSYQISSSTDDANTQGATIWTTTATDYLAGLSSYTGLYRFTGVTLPSNAIITSAYIQFKTGATNSGIANTTIWGEQSNASATFSTFADYAGRTTTAASVAWNGIEPWVWGGTYNSANISTIIQELVIDYSGLTSANIGIFIIGAASDATRNYLTYNQSPTQAPTLYISYITVPVVTTQAVSSVIYSAPSHYALLNGNVVSVSGGDIDQRGFVYGTTSVTTNPGNVTPPLSGYTTNSTAYSSSLGAYTSNVTGMVAGTKYYVRATAHNLSGWAYGEEVSFTTLTNPTITNLPATYTTNATSILNSQVTFDGNTSCNVSYGWGLVSGAWGAYTVYTNVSGTHTTGSFPSVALSSLNASSTYYYNVQIQNSYGVAYGTELSFTTTTGVSPPSNLIAVPTDTSISLTWVKGSGSQYTMVRYSTGTYPATVTDGTALPLTTLSGVMMSGLTAGTTYYISAWGKSSTYYSATYTTVLSTTLAAATITTASNTTATPNNAWVQVPSDTKVANIPVASAFVEWVSDTYNQSTSMLWYFLWFFTGVGFGIIAFRFSDGKFFVAFLIEALWFGLGVALGLIMLWILVIFFILGAGMSFFGDRR